jgi:hypothetical protein
LDIAGLDFFKDHVTIGLDKYKDLNTTGLDHNKELDLQDLTIVIPLLRET